MFKILAVICSLGGECHPFITEEGHEYRTLQECDRKAEEVIIKLHGELKNLDEFASIKVGCVGADWTPPTN